MVLKIFLVDFLNQPELREELESSENVHGVSGDEANFATTKGFLALESILKLFSFLRTKRF